MQQGVAATPTLLAHCCGTTSLQSETHSKLQHDAGKTSVLGRWLVPVSYRYTYVDAATEQCHVVGRWRTSQGLRFEHVPLQMCSAEVFRGKGAMLKFTRSRRRQARTLVASACPDMSTTCQHAVRTSPLSG